MITGSLVAVVTPMHSDGSIDQGSFQRLIDMHVAAGTAGLIIAGTTGESATLEKSEHVGLVRIAAEHAAGRIPIIAGTGSNATRQTIDLSLAVGRFPIDGYLVVVPYYNKPTQKGLFRHFAAIADAVDKPVLLYNVPGRTVADLQPETVIRLAEHERIIGIKEATGDLARIPVLRDGCGSAFGLYSGDDATGREFMLQGGQGVISVTSNVAPRQMADMCAAAIAGDAASAAEIDSRLADLHRGLFIESNPIPVKWAMQRMGLIPDGIRLPLTPLAAEYHSVVEAALQKADLL
ncbi:MAG: 4-hydroxy-tetrahydrodipicolinate synthase [Gammaproteobacteria bacterium]|nr:4-hydroxy-tetrahydrodipicolinate synthase [Gammaproteobacteria bacterium]